MEITNEKPRNPIGSKRGKPEPGVVGGYIGALLVVIGLFWLLHNFDVLSPRVYDVLLSWQMLMVGIGGYLLAARKYVAGAIVGGLGVVFVMMDALDIYISMGKVALPVILIAIGAVMLITKLGRKQ